MTLCKQDALLARHTTTLQAACAALPRLADALALLRSWARQQGCAGRPDGVTGFHLSMLAAHLHQRTTLVRPPLPFPFVLSRLLPLGSFVRLPTLPPRDVWTSQQLRYDMLSRRLLSVRHSLRVLLGVRFSFQHRCLSRVVM